MRFIERWIPEMRARCHALSAGFQKSGLDVTDRALDSGNVRSMWRIERWIPEIWAGCHRSRAGFWKCVLDVAHRALDSEHLGWTFVSTIGFWKASLGDRVMRLESLLHLEEQ